MRKHRHLFVITCCLAGMGIFANSASAQKQSVSRPPAKKAPIVAPAAISQPPVLALPVEKCDSCPTMVRRRLAVLPPDVGAVPLEMAVSPTAFGQFLRDRIEQTVAAQPSLVVVNREDFDAIVTEQQFSRSPGANKEFAPHVGKAIPAQFLLLTRIDAVNVSRSTSETFDDPGVELNREADQLQRELNQAAASVGDVSSSLSQLQVRFDNQDRKANFFYNQCMILNNTPGASWQDKLTCGLQAVAEAKARDNIGTSLDILRREHASHSAVHNALSKRITRLRDEAKYSQRTRTETQKTTLSATVVWRIVDTSFGVVVATGNLRAEADTTRQFSQKEGLGESTAKAAEVPYDSLANTVVADLATRIAPDVSGKLTGQPFAVKIAKVDAAGVVVNCGRDCGLTAGDTFGVRQKRELLTDPDTGLALEAPGPPIGLIRIKEVYDRSSLGQVIQKTGKLSRGDELEWVGIYQLVTQ